MRSWRMYPPPRRGCQVSQLWSPHAAEGTPTAERFSPSKRMGRFPRTDVSQGICLGLTENAGYPNCPNLWICYMIYAVV